MRQCDLEKLLNKRMHLVKLLSPCKKKFHLPSEDKNRENVIREKYFSQLKNKCSQDKIDIFLEEVFSQAKEIQKNVVSSIFPKYITKNSIFYLRRRIDRLDLKIIKYWMCKGL